MFTKIITLLLVACASLALAAAGTVGVTPHDMYSSSVGVLGCKIDTNRVAYWPMPVGCTSICVQVSYHNRSLVLLRQSGGAYDISYDAWNFLFTGQSAIANPQAGGAISVDYQDVAPESCAGLIHSADGGLPLSAANSMNYLVSCLNRPNSWVAQHYGLYNILNPTCTYGYDEICSLNLTVSNQATCPHQLGDPAVLIGVTVNDIEYITGALVPAA